jgi:hypothetical protein
MSNEVPRDFRHQMFLLRSNTSTTLLGEPCLRAGFFFGEKYFRGTTSSAIIHKQGKETP